MQIYIVLQNTKLHGNHQEAYIIECKIQKEDKITTNQKLFNLTRINIHV